MMQRVCVAVMTPRNIFNTQLLLPVVIIGLFAICFLSTDIHIEAGVFKGNTEKVRCCGQSAE